MSPGNQGQTTGGKSGDRCRDGARQGWHEIRPVASAGTQVRQCSGPIPMQSPEGTAEATTWLLIGQERASFILPATRRVSQLAIFSYRSSVGPPCCSGHVEEEAARVTG